MKNIDIVKVNKKNSKSKEEAIYRAPKSLKNQNNRPKRQKNIGLGIGFAFKSSILSVFDSGIFLASFIRNIFSIRTIFFIAIPIIYFQLKYIIVLKPDQLLDRLKSFISPQNTFQFVGFGLAFLIIVILSWLADTILTPGLYRYRYQKIDSRPTKVSIAVKESIRNVGGISLNKLIKALIFIGFFLLLVLSIYLMYVVGYGSLKSQFSLYITVLMVFSFIYLIYVKFRFYMQTSYSIALGSSQNKLLISSKQSFMRPLRSIAQSFIWLGVLLAVITVSLGLVFLESQILYNTESISLNILYLSIITTSLYLLWSSWTAFQVGYWSGLVNYERALSHVHFQADEESGYFGLWILIIVIMIIIAVYFFVSLVLSSQLSDILVGIWDKLPDSIKINIPKPN